MHELVEHGLAGDIQDTAGDHVADFSFSVAADNINRSREGHCQAESRFDESRMRVLRELVKRIERETTTAPFVVIFVVACPRLNKGQPGTIFRKVWPLLELHERMQESGIIAGWNAGGASGGSQLG